MFVLQLANYNDPHAHALWFKFLLFSLCIIASWQFGKYILSTKYVSYTAFGDNILLITRTRILSICGFFLVTFLDFIHTVLNPSYTPEWLINATMAVGFAFILGYSFKQNINKKLLSKLITTAYFVVLFTYVYRCFIFSFDLSLTTQLVCVLFFSLYIFQNTKSVLYLYGLIVFFFCIFFFLTDASKANMLFAIFALLQTFICVFFYFIVENKKTSRIVFSDKILNNSEQFILVANLNAEFVFINNYIVKTLGLEVSQLIKNGWWKHRGLNETEIHEMKNGIIRDIKNEVASKTRNTYFIQQKNELIHIDWQYTPFEGKYMLGIGKDVTEEVKQKEELKNLEIRFNKILNNAGDIIYTCDKHGNFNFINSTVSKIVGYEVDELMGKNFTSVIHPDYIKSTQEFYFNQFKQKIDTSYLEFKVITKSKETKWVSQTVNYILNAQQEIAGFQAVVRDITAIKTSEIEKQIKHQEQEEYNAVLTNLSLKSLDEYENFDAFLNYACSQVAITLGIERVSIWFNQIDNITSNHGYNRGETTRETSILLKKDYPIYINELNRGIIISVPDVLVNEKLAELKNNYAVVHNIKSLLDLPIRSNGELVGVICCEKTETVKSWTEQDHNFVKSMADLISLNIEANKRKQAEIAIKASETNFRLLNETIDDVFWLYDLKNQKVLYKSPSALSLFGLAPEEYYANFHLWKTYIYEDDLPAIYKAHEAMNVNGSFELEYRIKTKEGITKWVLEKGFGIKDEEGRYTKCSGICTDITERKAKELIIETQTFDILSSINYAKRIQNALLPSKQKIESLPTSLSIYYKPKDIIGGDFYWVEQINDKIIIAVGDCTGHGVPGSLMTSLGINGLINAVTKLQLTNPANILNYLDDYIYGLLSKADSDEKVNDGMDIVIITIDNLTKQVEFCGAGRPLYYSKNNEILKIDGSRKSIGTKVYTHDFESISVTDITPDSVFYLFSDGMIDQFGGEKQKRLGSKNFHELLNKINLLPLDKQLKQLTEFYVEWMGIKHQTDDMVWLAISQNKK